MNPLLQVKLRFIKERNSQQVLCKLRLPEQVPGGLLCSGSRKSGN